MAQFSTINLSAIKRTQCLVSAFIRCSSSIAPQIKNIEPLAYDKNPEFSFLDQGNHRLMSNLARMSLEKVYKQQPVPYNRGKLEFMTLEQVEERNRKSLQKAKHRMQMPPILQIESDANEIISNDAALEKFSDTKFVITDISYGIKDHDRTILIRDTNGALLTAPPDVRKRINQVYFPKENRQIIPPLLFTDEHLQVALDKGLYEYILNRACVQYEPYEKEFHRITSLAYHHINDTRNFDHLRSTRYFGTMSFYLAWHRLIDNLLIDTLQKGFFANSVEIIALMYNLNKMPYDQYVLELINNPDELEKQTPEMEQIGNIIVKAIGKDAHSLRVDDVCLKFIEDYVNQAKAAQKSELHNLFQACKREHNAKKELLQSLLKSHGVSDSD